VTSEAESDEAFKVPVGASITEVEGMCPGRSGKPMVNMRLILAKVHNSLPV
jgi:hypothetical protein